jgi:hypothetical protein
MKKSTKSESGDSQSMLEDDEEIQFKFENPVSQSAVFVSHYFLTIMVFASSPPR